MTTQRELILAAAYAKLTAISGPSKSRNRSTEVDASEYPHIAMYDGGHRITPESAGASLYSLRFEVESYVTGSSDAAITQAIDAQYENIVKAVIDPADPVLGIASVRYVREVEMTDPENLNEGQSGMAAAFGLSFEIDFETAEGDPTVAG